MLNLEAVVYRMRFDDRHCPSGRVDERRSRRRRRRMVGIVAVCGDAEKPLVRHGGRIRKVGAWNAIERYVTEAKAKNKPISRANVWSWRNE